MCLLIKHSATTNFSDAFITDFYEHNSDGFGAAFGDGNRIHVVKTMGSLKEVIKMYRDFCANRECLIHFRMRTHGDTNLDNCHPYQITDKIWLAHNGVLSSGNPINRSMSDTWHFIEYFLRPIALSNEDQLFNPEFAKYLGEVIGVGNKFVIAHADGRYATINEKRGLTFQESWLSNTYAWSSHVHIPTKSWGNGGRSTWGNDYENWWENETPSKSNTSTILLPSSSDDTEDTQVKPYTYEGVLRTISNIMRTGTPRLEDWVDSNPYKAAFFVEHWYELTPAERHTLTDDLALLYEYVLEITEMPAFKIEANSVSRHDAYGYSRRYKR